MRVQVHEHVAWVFFFFLRDIVDALCHSRVKYVFRFSWQYVASCGKEGETRSS